MINPWCLTKEEMDEVRELIEDMNVESTSVIWLTALANLECDIYKTAMKEKVLTKEDALFAHKIISEDIRKYISKL